MSQSQRNLERKVACTAAELAERHALLAAAGVPIAARLYQRDVYVRAPSGRLKMRWITEDRDGARRVSAELIAYVRPDEAASRWSEYTVDPLDVDEAGAIETALLAQHGVLAVVAKRRALAIWGNTRVHFDDVEDLGFFIELETVITGLAGDEAVREHREVIDALCLDELPVIAGSYSDLLLDRFS